MFIFAVEVIVFVSLLYFIATQIIIPALQGKSLFPYFRKETELKAELVELEQTASELELAEIVKNRQAEIAAKAVAVCGQPEVVSDQPEVK
jgi:hypothetical protein